MAMYGNPYNSVIRIDMRDPDNQKVEEVEGSIPREIRQSVQKPIRQADYKFNCLVGEQHPLEIEVHNYVLVRLCTERIDVATSHHKLSRMFSEPEQEFIRDVRRRPEIEWAEENSFDGLYISKCEDVGSMKTAFSFAAYLKEEQATFWKLKYGGK